MIEATKVDSTKRGTAKQIEAIYPLSPMQEGMLFHTLMNPGTGIYLMQNRYYVEGEVDAVVFRRAWEQVIARHSILRTSFAWKSQKRPLQAVHKEVEVPLDVMDWRGTDRVEQISRLDVLLQRELEAGFDFAKAPLMRLRLIRLTDHTYQFVHSFHHILLDEWCISPLLMDFLAHYEASAQGRDCQADTPRPYRDYIAWLQTQDLEVAKAFWRDYLRDFSTPTPLTYDRPPEGLADQNEDAADHCVHLSADTTAALVSLAQRHRLTPNTFVQGAWAILLSYYSGDPDILFGVTVAGRPTDLLGVESVLGLFINTLPLRVRVSPDRHVLPWLKDVLAENIRLRQFEYTPLVHIQRCSEVPRGEALFHSLFVFENAPVDPALCDGRIMFRAEEEQYRVHTNYPMTVMGWPGKELGLKLSYDRRVFDSETVVRMIGHLKRVLEGMVEQPDARIGELPLLGQDERTQLLSTWVETTAQEPDDRSFNVRFEEQVRRTPQAPAVSWEGRVLSYHELNRQANRLAHALVSAGVGPESLVALLDERSPALLTMIVGVFKAGGAYLPLDPHHPTSRLVRILELSRVPVVVTSAGLLEHLTEAMAFMPQEVRPRILSLDTVLAEPGPEDNLTVRARPEHLAYVIYTSGSTGVPKGAMVTQGGMLNNMSSKLSSLSIAATDVIAQTASQCFDISVWQFLTALVCGARTHIVPDETVRDPARLLPHLEEAGISIFETVPALLQALLEAGRESDSMPALSGLRWVLPTGEALPPALCRHWFLRYPEIPLMNAYGPAECADDVAVHPITTAPPEDLLHIPIGRPIPNIRLYIVNRFLAPVPAGVSGELCIGGVGVGRGYLKDPVRTAESFVPDPFGPERGGRLYRTGDLARYRKDGTIEYLGRLDHQVKIRGFRIELGEIETHVNRHGSVRDAVVVVREDRPGDRRLVAYVVNGETEPVDAAALRQFLEAQLPEYMVPALFVPLDMLPRTVNGKVDRRALPAPGVDDHLAQSYVAPRTTMEELLAGMWVEILAVGRVGVHDNFFELGGHSLLVTQIVSRIRNTFHIEIPLRTAFECPTVAELATTVERIRLEETGPPPPPLVPMGHNGTAPLSFAQQRLWFLGELEPESWFYNLPFGLRIKGELDLSLLERSINEVVRRHEVLRTTIAVDVDLPVQIIAAEGVVSLIVEDFRSLPDSRREEEVQQASKSEARRLFDLSRGPLWRMRVLRLKEREHVILLTLHHIIADGWSLNVLMQEILSRYGALASGRTPVSHPLPIQYADYAHWQREWLQGDVLEAQLEYWKTSLNGAPSVLSLPTDRPRPALENHQGARYECLIPGGMIDQLRTLGRRQGATLFMTLLAAFQVLLLRYSGQTDVCIGTPIANRTRLEIEPLIGLFVNTLVLRTDLAGNPTFAGLLARVQEVVLGAQTHQDLPFEQLVDALQPMRALSHAPLFQVMFALQTTFSDALELPGLEISTFEVDPGSAQFDLSLDLLEGRAGVEAVFEYNADLFNAGTIRGMAAHLTRILGGIVKNPDARLSDLPMLTELEQRRVLVEWNETAPAGREDATFAELFETQVSSTPDAVAVTGPTHSLLYRDLDIRANRIANALMASGVGPDSVVAVLNERDPGTVAMLIGIFKASGAYLPLDPAHPAPRWASILELSRAAVVLTADSWKAQLADALALLPQSARPRLLTIEEILNGAWTGHRPFRGTSPSQLAYVIYTSGSTGTPKGAMVTQRGLTNHLISKLAMLRLGPGDVIAQTASLCFDISVWQCMTALLCGGRTLVVPDEIVHDPGRLLRDLGERGATVLEIVPTLLQGLLEVPGTAQPAVLSKLRWVLPTGEALSPELTRRWFEHYPDIPLLNAYGPAECADDVAMAEITAPPEMEAVSMPIGRPIHNMRLYILDRWLTPVPIGVPGELCVAGPGVGRGYLHDPARTAEAFVPNPFGIEPDNRLYRTGDLARYRPDGTIEFLGRMDHQVKLRGVRIELGEIEARLQAQPGVREAVAMVREDKPGQKRLAAYVVPLDGEVCDGEGLCGTLRGQLPESMVPSVVVPMDALPRTANGKVDRLALPVPGSANTEREWVAARTSAEETLTEIWAKVLGMDRVGIHDNFFELGGDSIQALQIVARAKQAGLMLTPRHMFQYQTPGELAAVVETDQAGTDGVPVLLPAEQGPVTGEVRLTPIQHWFFERKLPNPSHWNQSLLLEITEPLDRQALDAAVHYLLRQHDMLRTRFSKDGGVWVQQIEPDESGPLIHRVDLSTLSQHAQQTAFDAMSTKWQASLHLTEGPLLRVVWFDMGAIRPGRLLLVIHHLVVDGVSWRILLEDLHGAYLQHRQGQPIRLPDKSTSFKQWTERLSRYAQSEACMPEVSYWLDPRRAMVPALPVDRPDGDPTEASSETVTVSLGEAETRILLREVSAAYQTQINDVLLTALAQTLAGWAESRLVLIDLEGHGREDLFPELDLSRTVGWFTAVAPVLLEVGSTEPPGEALKTVKEQLRLMPNRGVGYGLLRYLQRGDAADRLRNYPEARVSFNYLGQLDQSLPEGSFLGLAKESPGMEHDPHNRLPYELYINAEVLGGQLNLSWTYSRNRYRQETIEVLSRTYMRLLQELIEHCVSPEAGGYTPSDFPDVEIGQQALDAIFERMDGSHAR